MESFLKSIGVADDVLEHLDRAQLAFQRPALLWAGLLLLIPVAYLIYRRQRDNLSSIPMGYRIALSVTRVFILLILVTVLAGPYLKIDHRVTKKPIVAVLFDESQSMGLPAGPFEKEELLEAASAAGLQVDGDELSDANRKELTEMTRGELARRVMQASHEQFALPLEKDFELRYYTFSRRPSPLTFQADGDAESGATDEERPKVIQAGAASHIGEAVYHVLDDAAGRPVSAMLLFSDGQNTGGRSPSLAAHAAADVRSPIFVAPMGSDKRLRDVSVVDVYSTGQVAVGDIVSVHVTIESQGFDGRPVNIELKDGDEVLDTSQTVVRDAEHQHVELKFEATEQRAGERKLTVELPPLPEETEKLRANNIDTTLVRISKEKLKVLLIDGMPRWDFRFIKNAIRRDNGLAGRFGDNPEVVLENEWRRLTPEKRSEALPKTVDELAEYGAVIVGDASPALLSAEFLARLDEAVRERGVGLVVAAGPMSMPHRYDKSFQNLLPVKLTAKQAGREAPVYKPFKLEVSPDGAVHETMRLYDDPGRNQNVWARMPPYYWCAAAERPAPAATVLAWNPSVEGRFGKLPLIAYHYAGEGKVMFVGSDSTWLWRQNVGDRFFYKFWGQAIRFVAPSEEEKSKQSRIVIRPVRAQIGEEAQIELMAFNDDGEPETGKSKRVALLVPGQPQRTLELVADKNKKGRYTGVIVPEKHGVFRLAYQPPSGKDVEATFQVLMSPEEFRHPNLNRAELELLASTTGGELVSLDALGELPAKLSGEAELKPLHREASLWDNWLTLTLLVLTYSVDVGIRRLMGLS